MSDEAETLRDGRYAICGILGEGSQGATLEAVDKRDGTLVAIKRFRVRGARSWKDVELAEREARVLLRLDHPLLPHATEHFEEGGALYLVMEKVEGPTLAGLPKSSPADVVRFLRDADRVLAYLHGGNPPVLHRDIKPSNVIRRPGRDGKPPEHVLVDFGSVRDSLKPAGGSTVVGTFGYMAPEQFQGRALPQSDVYAVGATAMFMLTGQQPETLPHRGLAIDVRAALGSGHGTRRDDALTAALTRMLEPDPDKRPARIASLLADLEPEEPPEKPPARAKRKDAPREEPKGSRREKRREKRREREARRQRAPSPEPRRTMPPLAASFVVIAVAVARLAVAVSLRIVVPTVLSLLSLVFGEPLRRASRRVMDAGASADRAMQRALARALGREPDPGPRIVTPDAQQRVDDGVEEGVDDLLDEVDAAYDEVASEIETLRRKRTRKR